jgi:hypothetical protein
MELSHLVTNESQLIDYEQMDEHQIRKLFTNVLTPITNESQTSLITLDHYDIFRIMKNKYYVVNRRKFIGNGTSGHVHEGHDVATREPIVVKYGKIGINEIECLKKNGSYIGSYSSTQNIVLMHRALGNPYLQILMDQSIASEKKIQIHKQIINALNQLFMDHGICHNDMQARHVYIDGDKITLIDFGESDFSLIPVPIIRCCGSESPDVHEFNLATLHWTTYYNCDKIHLRYIESLVNNRKRLNVFYSGVFGVLVMMLGLKLCHKINQTFRS